MNDREDYSSKCYNSAGTSTISCPIQPTYSPGPGSSSCSSLLLNLLGSGCHWMYSDSSGRGVYCDGPMTKSAKEGDTSTTAGCSGGGATYSPNPSYSYTPSPSFPEGQYWDYSNSSCKSNTSYGGCTGTTQSSCTSVSSCYWSSSGNYCYYQSTSPGTATYTPSPSCPSGQWWDYSSSSCKVTSSTDCPSGQYWNGSSCVSSETTYTPYPTSTYTYTPPPSCASGQWWDTATNSCQGSATTYTPYPTSDPSASCSSSGGTWDGSSCTYPTYSAPPPPPPPTSMRPNSYMIAHCQELGRTWNGSNCRANGLFARIYESYTNDFATILRAFGF